MAIRFLFIVLLFISIMILTTITGVIINNLILTIKYNRQLKKLEKEQKKDYDSF